MSGQVAFFDFTALQVPHNNNRHFRGNGHPRERGHPLLLKQESTAGGGQY